VVAGGVAQRLLLLLKGVDMVVAGGMAQRLLLLLLPPPACGSARAASAGL